MIIINRNAGVIGQKYLALLQIHITRNMAMVSLPQVFTYRMKQESLAMSEQQLQSSIDIMGKLETMPSLRMSKIVATIGPSSEDEPTFKLVANAKIDVMRINFSHATYVEATNRINLLRKYSPLSAWMLDTKGPEIRTGSKKDDSNMKFENNQQIILTNNIEYKKQCKNELLYVDAPSFDGVNIGHTVLLGDGKISLVVESKDGREKLLCKVQNSGEISSRAGVNFPSGGVDLPSLTELDEEHIRWGVRHDVDIIAASFIQTKDDVLAIRSIIEDEHEKTHDNTVPLPKIVAKIECQKALCNSGDIIKVVDGIMIARGDLGVETPLANVTILQKKLIAQATMFGKPTIVATQMLESMIKTPRPTRAEVADVSNAIEDGAHAVMLSGESANGKYPVESVSSLNMIAGRADTYLRTYNSFIDATQASVAAHQESESSIQAVSGEAEEIASIFIATSVGAKGIVVDAMKGETVAQLSMQYGHIPIFAVCHCVRTLRGLSLLRGVFPILTQKEKFDTDETVVRLLEAGYVERRDPIVILESRSSTMATSVEGQSLHVTFVE